MAIAHKKIQIVRPSNLNMDPTVKNDFLKNIKKDLPSKSAIGFQLPFEWPRFFLITTNPHLNYSPMT